MIKNIFFHDLIMLLVEPLKLITFRRFQRPKSSRMESCAAVFSFDDADATDDNAPIQKLLGFEKSEKSEN